MQNAWFDYNREEEEFYVFEEWTYMFVAIFKLSPFMSSYYSTI